MVITSAEQFDSLFDFVTGQLIKKQHTPEIENWINRFQKNINYAVSPYNRYQN